MPGYIDVAYIIDSDGKRWKLKKDDDTSTHNPTPPKYPTKLYVEGDNKEWNFKKQWETDINDDGTYYSKLADSKTVLEWAIDWMQGLEYGIEKIIVDQCRKEDVPDGDYEIKSI